jgi:hypothetical protein
MAFHLCVLSPLAKIFQPLFYVGTEAVTTSDLMRDPERIFKHEPFSVVVERSQGSIRFTHGIPKLVSDETLALYLSGGETGEWKQETDFTGIAQLPLSPEATGVIMAALTGQGALELAENAHHAAKQALDAAKLISESRVLRQVRHVYALLKKQREQNKEDKRGDAPPTPTEYLCAYVLAAEEAKKSDETKKITEQFKNLMSHIA